MKSTKRWYHNKLEDAKDKLWRKIKEQMTIEDKDAHVYFNTLIGRMEITPKTMTVEEFHYKTILKLEKAKVIKMVNCYIEYDKDGSGKVILQRR